MDVKGKVTVITGASMGIGRATAILFAAEGARLVLAARTAPALEALAKEIQEKGGEAHVIPTDMRDPAAIRRLIDGTVERFGRIDILINNAGQSVAGQIADVKVEDFRAIMDLNVYGPLLAMQAAIPHMRAAGGGLILNISSMVSKLTLRGLGAYAATKAALNLLSGTARAELAEENIRVLTVYPRTTSTDFGRHAIGNTEMRERQRANAARYTVVDTAEQVAEKILAAARDEPEEQYMDHENRTATPGG